MNKQRLLWVILSITILVIIIVVAGLWLVRDTKTVPVSEAAKEPPTQFDAFDYINSNVPVTGLIKDNTAKTDESGKSFTKQDVAIGPKDDSIFEPYTTKKSTATDTTQKRPSTTTPPMKKTSTTMTKSTAKSNLLPVKPGASYWIQTGSYKSKSKAENCNAVLVENGLAARIVSKMINNETYFRVRIGPYPNLREAEKFLIWIKKIDGLEASYISRERL